MGGDNRNLLFPEETTLGVSYMPNKQKIKLVPVFLELVGIAGISTGIGIEIATEASFGHLIITCSSVAVAIGAIVWGKFMRGGKSW